MSDDDGAEKGLDKALGQIAVETARDGRAFLGKIFGEAATEFGGMLGEQMRYWRFKNLNTILSEAERITSNRGYNIELLQSLSFGDAFRTVEAASYEESETVQDLWARLIANAVDPKTEVTVKKVYIDILKSISPAEAMFLDLLWQCETAATFRDLDQVKKFNADMNRKADQQWRCYKKEDRDAAIQNLVRIRCVTFRPRPVDMSYLFGSLPRDMQRDFRSWAAVDPQKFQEVINQLGEMIFIGAGVKEYQNTNPIPLQRAGGITGYYGAKIEIPEMNFLLTALGKDLMAACDEGKPMPSADTPQAE